MNPVVEQARKWLGVKWRHQGRTEYGIDCVGLLVVVARGLGMDHTDSTDYKRYAHGSEFLKHLNESGLISQNISDVGEGSVLVLLDRAYPCHVAIQSIKYDKPHIVHAYAPRRKVVEDVLTDQWLAKRVAAYEFPI